MKTGLNGTIGNKTSILELEIFGVVETKLLVLVKIGLRENRMQG